jgi:hypothetical protein
MENHLYDPSPGQSPSLLQRLHQILGFWEQLDVGGSPGETKSRELEPLKVEVMAALKREPMDVTTAESLTAYAALLLTGQTEF